MRTQVSLRGTRRLLIVCFAVLFSLPAWAITFTNNTSISVGNSQYDGSDLVISNCTVRVDGPHVFDSLRVAAGGVLTHSYVPSGGMVSNIMVVTNESQVLSSTNSATLDNSNVIVSTVSVTDSTGTNFYTNGLDFTLAQAGDLTELSRTTNSSIPDGATVLVDYDSLIGAAPAGLNITVTSNVLVDLGGAINASGIGYGGGMGPGAGPNSGGPYPQGGGAGYGGAGGTGSTNMAGGGAYGNYYTPTNLGSGGGASYDGPGGAGGGLIDITAGGSITVNGSITANGANGTNNHSGGGSGGGISLTAATLSGEGSITANGGNGGGGGGRIALSSAATTFGGSISAYGGSGSPAGGAGTVYTQVTGQNASLLIDNGNQAGTNTPLFVASNTVNVTIQNRAVVFSTASWSVGSLTVASNSSLWAGPLELYVTSVGTIDVEQGGAIIADGVGPGPGAGTGPGHFYAISPYYPCGGAGYGGNGATASITNATGGTYYGSQTSPAGPGSGGGTYAPYSIGGNGGGAIQITSQNGTVQVDGTISANGGNGTGSGGGGGSGGTIVLTGGALFGSGSITANGGNGANSIGGGGGGGRVVISPTTTFFEGTISAYGGGGGNWGGAGTVLSQPSKQNAQLVLDNNGHPGTNTPVQSASADLVVQNGAIATPASGPFQFVNLYLNSNGWIYPQPGSVSALNLTLTANATIESGGGIIADFLGYNISGEGSGPGRGAVTGTNYTASGAGHGGMGGAGPLNTPAGGGTYDSVSQPTTPGSAGGGASPVNGGAGGGVVRLSVTGTLQNDGVISANGGTGLTRGTGGGSGGAIWISAPTVFGGGTVSANGGSGADIYSGGGGGGMISVSCNNNYFSGMITAYGGSGANWGGTGTVDLQVGSSAQLILDNQGHSGAVTPVTASGYDLTLRNGAVGSLAGGGSFGNLLIGSNASLSNSGSYSTITCSTVNIQPGGSIVDDFQGFAAGSGQGAGHFSTATTNYPCSGGGHAGFGGNSASSLALGGQSYDTPTSPSYEGSGGGAYSPVSIGGAGGGFIKLTVTGLLQVDGTISANGGNGSGLGGGGGAGGTIYLTAGSFSGGGLISANGGYGVAGVGGGGSGGCIAISVTGTSGNQFSGAMTAYGGGGANWGAAGTIDYGSLIVDNNGQIGAVTSLGSSSTVNLILRNGAVASSGMYGVGAAGIIIQSNAWLWVSNSSSLAFTTAVIEAGGGILADGLGYAANGGYGNGAGHYATSSPSYPCGGGGHGGSGGNCAGNGAFGGAPNDSLTAPTAPGSGGGGYQTSTGGSGGGLISMSVIGVCEVEGVISANGGNGGGPGGGGGAGGTIKLTAGTLTGQGIIRANGGNGVASVGGGGGGGIILVSINTTNQFTGSLSAYGGGGANAGGAGSIDTYQNGSSQIIIDSGGLPGATTLLSPSLPSSTALTVRNGATALATGSLNIASLFLTSNSWLLVSNNATFSTFSFSTATIQAGSGMIGDSFGSPAGSGNGAGREYNNEAAYYASGAGHGGIGGNSAGNYATGGSAYDSATSPSTAGSGGGSYSQASGGPGGAGFAVSVSGLLQVDGTISANGGAGTGGGGGGSGGSIKLTAGTLAGAGAISANGGAAASPGGGGAGGIIALYPGVNNFTGSVSATGGGGANRGGAGTLYISTTGQSSPQLIIDNGGIPGAATPIQGISSSSTITLRNGAVAYQQAPLQTFASLTIGSNAWLEPGSSYPGSVSLTITGNATLQAGGGIDADASGYAAGAGPGAGNYYYSAPNYPCGGAGYGGNGASVGGSATGGNAYGSITSPSANGSGGAGYSSSYGGVGGGSVKLTVSGILSLDGTISANGGNGTGSGGGGGAGGSIWLAPGAMTGAGSIAANGGNGAGSIGGGGGGGRIALFYNTSSFAGQTSAHGGGGGAYGGGGTIYVKTNSQATGELIVDNGGEPGANTPLTSSLGLPGPTFNLVIQHGGSGAFAESPSSLVNNLTIASGGVLGASSSQTIFDLLVLGNVEIAAGGAIAVDGQGYGVGAGPGAGQSVDSTGSGGGYGGVGGASQEIPGGQSYGSTNEPVDFGSGGGAGAGPPGGSSGGGALRLNVGGVLSVDGQITAEGMAGLQDDSGGGSGGSIWVTAGTLVGGGHIGSDGGAGALDYGGGGAGGRIALYSGNDIYSGTITANGGVGDVDGGNGTIVNSNVFPLLVLSNSPSGVVSNAVSSLTLYFNRAPNPNTVQTGDITITTPNGPLAFSSLSLTMLNSSTYLVSFPLQTAVGTYSVAISNVADLSGQPLGGPYAGSFSISLPVIAGTITDTNGNPIAGVLLQVTGGLSSTTTDTNGNYAVGFFPGASFTVTPSLGGFLFSPASISYANVTATVTNQNYLATSVTLTPSAGASNTFYLTWQGLAGVNYQVLTSTNLINWTPYSAPIPGSNGPVTISIPLGGQPQEFFQLQSSY